MSIQRGAGTSRSQRDVYDVSMQATLTAPSGWRQRAVPLACGGALAAAGAVVALNDPSAPGSRFPPCAFHALTGLWCPGCGLTRGVHQLLNGHVMSALGYNLFVPVVLAVFVVSWWRWLRSTWGRPSRPLTPRTTRWIAVAMPVVLLAYTVLRNIPAEPFRALAP
jgi:hypothetical protein